MRNMVCAEDLIKMYMDEQREVEELERIKSLTESICVLACYLSGEDLEVLLQHLSDEAKKAIYLYRAVECKAEKQIEMKRKR